MANLSSICLHIILDFQMLIVKRFDEVYDRSIGIRASKVGVLTD